MGKDPDVDGGFAWFILAGCFVMYMLVVGTIKSYGVFYTEMLDYFQAGSGNTAWIGSVCILFMLGLGPFSNCLAMRFSFRVISFMGGILLGAGFVASAFVPSIDFMYLTFGLISGVGYGLSFAPCSTIISFYFEKNRALANGLTVSGSGIGALAFPFLYQFLIEHFAFKGALWIMGGILLNVSAAACIFRQPRLLVNMKRKQQEAALKRRKAKHDGNGLLNGDISVFDDEPEPEIPEAQGCCGFNLKCSLFKNPRFTLYAFAFTLCMNGYGNNVILIPSHVKALGYDDTKKVLSVSILGGCEVVSRIVFGWFADRNYIKRKYIFFICMVVSAAFAFMAPFFDSYIFIAIYAAVIGIFPGSFWSLISVMVIEVVGMKDFTAGFGLISLCLACGSVISQPIIGWLMDSTGNWHASFILSGWLLLIAGFAVILEPLVGRCCDKPETEEEPNTTLPYDIPLRRRPTVQTNSYETGSLLDDDNDVSFSSQRISKIYRPVPAKRTWTPSTAETTAPLASTSEI